MSTHVTDFVEKFNEILLASDVCTENLSYTEDKEDLYPERLFPYLSFESKYPADEASGFADKYGAINTFSEIFKRNIQLSLNAKVKKESDDDKGTKNV